MPWILFQYDNLSSFARVLPYKMIFFEQCLISQVISFYDIVTLPNCLIPFFEVIFGQTKEGETKTAADLILFLFQHLGALKAESALSLFSQPNMTQNDTPLQKLNASVTRYRSGRALPVHLTIEKQKLPETELLAVNHWTFHPRNNVYHPDVSWHQMQKNIAVFWGLTMSFWVAIRVFCFHGRAGLHFDLLGVRRGWKIHLEVAQGFTNTFHQRRGVFVFQLEVKGPLSIEGQHLHQAHIAVAREDSHGLVLALFQRTFLKEKKES